MAEITNPKLRGSMMSLGSVMLSFGVFYDIVNYYYYYYYYQGCIGGYTLYALSFVCKKVRVRKITHYVNGVWWVYVSIMLILYFLNNNSSIETRFLTKFQCKY